MSQIWVFLIILPGDLVLVPKLVVSGAADALGNPSAKLAEEFINFLEMIILGLIHKTRWLKNVNRYHKIQWSKGEGNFITKTKYLKNLAPHWHCSRSYSQLLPRPDRARILSRQCRDLWRCRTFSFVAALIANFTFNYSVNCFYLIWWSKKSRRALIMNGLMRNFEWWAFCLSFFFLL